MTALALVTLARPRPCCAMCSRPASRTGRRGLCQTCYRKLKENGLPLPPCIVRAGRRRPAQTRRHLRNWVASLPPERREQLRAILAEMVTT